MDVLSYVALAMLLFMIALVGVFIWFLGGLPGRVATARNHPYSKAITMGGWAALFLGVVTWPVILMWAYSTPELENSSPYTSDGENQLRDEVARLTSQVESLSRQIHSGETDV